MAPTRVVARSVFPRRPLVAFMLALAASSGAATVQGQAGSALFEPGSVVAKMASVAEPSLHYSVFLPSTYTPDRDWPMVLLMDPRGRAPVPLERFRQAADQLGYVLVSSYDTRSDVDGDPSTRALRAMVTDADTLFSIDRSRIYLAGLSGTARSAWFHGSALRGSIAGVISFGAGGMPGERIEVEPPFAFFGAAGRRDFNYEELRALVTRLQLAGVPARFVPFDGGHQWPPPEVATEALEWIEVQAMRAGLRPNDQAFIEDAYTRWLSRADDLGRNFGELERFFLYRDLVAGFDGLVDTSLAHARARELTEMRRVQVELQEVTGFSEQHREYLARMVSVFDGVGTGGVPLRIEAIADALEVSALLRAANQDPPNPASYAAARKLEAVFVNACFYQVRHFLSQDRAAEALVMLQLADRIKPEDPRVLMAMAAIHARNGFRQAAAEMLLRAAAAALDMDATMLEDPYFYEPNSGELLLPSTGVR